MLENPVVDGTEAQSGRDYAGYGLRARSRIVQGAPRGENDGQ